MALKRTTAHQDKMHVKTGTIEQDGLHGWLVVFAAFITHLITHGIVYSYGIIFITFEDIFGASKAETSWIASITTGTLYLSGPFASVYLRRHGSRMVAFTGSTVSFIGCFLTMFAPNLYFMYFSLGFLTGIGYGLIFIPAVVEVTMSFKKHRALACGIAVSGAGAGAFIFSPLIELLLHTYGWRGSLLLCSGLLLNCVPCSLIFRNKFTLEDETRNSTTENEKIQDCLDISKEYLYSNNKDDCNANDFKLCNGTENKCQQELVQIKSDDIDKEFVTENELQEPSVLDKMLQDAEERRYNHKGSRKSFAGGPISQLSFFQILRQKEMIFFYCAQTLFFLGFYFPFIGIPGMAIKHGTEESKAAWIISAIGISTVFGRVVLGYLSDRPYMNSTFFYKVALLVAGISTSLVPLLPKYAAFITYALAFGLSTAVLLSQTTVVLVEIIGMERMPDAMGLNNMFSGIGALLGPPILGLLYDKTESYTYSFIASGLSMTMGGILLFLMSCMK